MFFVPKQFISHNIIIIKIRFDTRFHYTPPIIIAFELAQQNSSTQKAPKNQLTK